MKSAQWRGMVRRSCDTSMRPFRTARASTTSGQKSREVAIPKVSSFSHVTMPLRGFDLHHVPHHLRHVCRLRLEGCLGPDVPTVWQAVPLCDDFPRGQPSCVWEDCSKGVGGHAGSTHQHRRRFRDSQDAAEVAIELLRDRRVPYILRARGGVGSLRHGASVPPGAGESPWNTAERGDATRCEDSPAVVLGSESSGLPRSRGPMPP
jgi:hypothetical protein